MVHKIWMVLGMMLISAVLFAQEDAWVYFTTKPNAAYYFNNPQQILSQRALERRAVQNIVLDDKDLPIDNQYYNTLKNSQGITVMARSKWLNALHIRGEVQAIRNLQQLPFVQHIEFANYSLNTITGRRPKAAKNTITKALENPVVYNYGTSFTQIQMLNGQLLHNHDYTGNGKVIAVMDSGYPGVNTLQPFANIRDNSKLLGGYNFVGRNSNIYNGGTHGTLVLSAMAGFTDEKLVGTAPGASYYLFVTEDVTQENPLEESLWVEAAEMADSLGVDVINTSLGYFTYDKPEYSYTYDDINGQTAFITRGADVAFSRGMICVTSGGNSGATNNPNIGVPADAATTLTVGAVAADRQVTAFSSRGLTVDGRIKPDVMALGAFATVCDENGNITTASGTSFSSPVTAGLVACLWQALPDKTNAEIIQLVKESADRYSTPDAVYGYGIPDFNLALEKGRGLVGNKQSNFLLYPNPAAASTTLRFPGDVKEAVVVFYNTLGQLVLKQRVYNINPQLQVQHLPAGIYGYTIESSLGIQEGKMVKR